MNLQTNYDLEVARDAAGPEIIDRVLPRRDRF
jgi:plasmid maintenance system antidote protein VapI